MHTAANQVPASLPQKHYDEKRVSANNHMGRDTIHTDSLYKAGGLTIIAPTGEILNKYTHEIMHSGTPLSRKEIVYGLTQYGMVVYMKARLLFMALPSGGMICLKDVSPDYVPGITVPMDCNSLFPKGLL